MWSIIEDGYHLDIVLTRPGLAVGQHVWRRVAGVAADSVGDISTVSTVSTVSTISTLLDTGDLQPGVRHPGPGAGLVPPRDLPAARGHVLWTRGAALHHITARGSRVPMPVCDLVVEVATGLAHARAADPVLVSVLEVAVSPAHEVLSLSIV